MNEYIPASPHATLPGVAPPPRSRCRLRRMVAAAAMAPVLGLSVGLAASSPAAAASAPAGGASNARSGPEPGGTSGTVATVSTSGFTLTTAAGQKVTVETAYEKKSSPTAAGAIKKGQSVLVLGTVSSTTIKATEVIVQTAQGTASASTAAAVVPFQRGDPTTSKEAGKIPTDYTEGSGKIVSGTTADKATAAALAAYPGGVVDRVVKLSNGEYEVHTIGVNWPHHIFVNQSFKVVGAD